ncbi:hypothetical protein T11_7775 [Trichinella zimbabwensis]|uniref:Uncharacterized protein n=1 Tax=Trichinella zimbabwensis TaxID=268475 RepID=A0A0V1HF99_9BILA|nr:hypothetical protein T11_7775 [Trichinella zimbabwensis]
MGVRTFSAHSIEQYLLACCYDSSQETDESNIRYDLHILLNSICLPDVMTHHKKLINQISDMIVNL